MIRVIHVKKNKCPVITREEDTRKLPLLFRYYYCHHYNYLLLLERHCWTKLGERVETNTTMHLQRVHAKLKVKGSRPNAVPTPLKHFHKGDLWSHRLKSVHPCVRWTTRKMDSAFTVLICIYVSLAVGSLTTRFLLSLFHNEESKSLQEIYITVIGYLGECTVAD